MQIAAAGQCRSYVSCLVNRGVCVSAVLHLIEQAFWKENVYRRFFSANEQKLCANMMNVDERDRIVFPFLFFFITLLPSVCWRVYTAAMCRLCCVVVV